MIKPSSSEFQFLTLAYNRFYELYEEVMAVDFWERSDWERFSKIQQAFSIYAEVLNYEPMKHVIEKIRAVRPSMEAEMGSELFKFVRNVFAHFPFFVSWNEIWISKPVINWYKEGMTIDKFLKKFAGHTEVKYRIWEPVIKEMTYISIAFPGVYEDVSKIYLKDMLSEKEGVKFCLVMMRQIMDTQVAGTK